MNISLQIVFFGLFSLLIVPALAVSSITNLGNSTTTSSINWTWDNPVDDFNYTMVYINGSFAENTSNSYYLLAFLASGSNHTISTQTVGTTGEMNDTWVNQTVFMNTTLPVNSIRNPGLENGTENWSFYSNGVGSFTTAGPGFVGNKSAKISIYATGGNIQLYQSNLNLTSGYTYRLTFSANSTTGHDMKVAFIKHSSPYTVYMDDVRVYLNETKNDFTIDFTPLNLAGTSSDVRLMMKLSEYAT
jgi:hypothetical protein